MPSENESVDVHEKYRGKVISEIPEADMRGMTGMQNYTHQLYNHLLTAINNGNVTGHQPNVIARIRHACAKYGILIHRAFSQFRSETTETESPPLKDAPAREVTPTVQPSSEEGTTPSFLRALGQWIFATVFRRKPAASPLSVHTTPQQRGSAGPELSLAQFVTRLSLAVEEMNAKMSQAGNTGLTYSKRKEALAQGFIATQEVRTLLSKLDTESRKQVSVSPQQLEKFMKDYTRLQEELYDL
ncbi:hypothetical protein HY285_02500 [Candidatus Peregrinibacteria bacterium]|nr:hypothetical protein [Candidatus Peregrinibacteria bacterium]MBI3816391.1 hypothetical protein [Candidatus Peregrinibacteria bacterium]